MAIFRAVMALGLALVVVGTAVAQYFRAGIDTVLRFQPGTGQSVGQQAPYFPQNIFGLPDSSARWNVPSASPKQICSLGLDGVIVVGWKDFVLVDAPGPDFTVFENAFVYANGKIFAEPAEVSVSKDGVQFVPFPFDTLTLEGCAGRTPTNGAADPFDPSVSGGDAFDLATIGVDTVRFIRIRDVTRLVLNNRSHPFWNPVLSGFDLDAVVGLHLVPLAQGEHPFTLVSGDKGILLYGPTIPVDIDVYTVDGRRIVRKQKVRLPVSIVLPGAGSYWIILQHSLSSLLFPIVWTPWGGGWRP